ncbi:MAG: GNAT family N-acetyltransferase [Defluviitaleaceae bacterium]|nr:GNAT family N-acetyltransferase [Defluviitaleaceae bacterium]
MNIPFDVTGIQIETERLLLRPFEVSDLVDFNAYASVPGVGEGAGWEHHKTLEASQAILQSFLENKDNFAMYHKGDKKVIGSLGLHSGWSSRNETYKHLKAKELGYVLSKDYWGQGLTPEAVNAVVKYCFSQLGLEALAIAHSPSNTASRRAAEKCGFTYIETGKYFSKLLQKEIDDIRHIIIKAVSH